MLKDALPKIITDTLPGPKAKEILKRREAAIPSAIRCIYPVVIKRGEGAMLEDVDGNIFLDWVGGVGVLNVGYSKPELVEAVKQQADRYFHTMMNIVTHEGYIALAEMLNQLVPVRGYKKKTMLVNSGAEALENAVKVAKGYTKRPNIIVFSGAFHGRTNLTMAMTSKKAYSIGMGPFPDGVYRAEYPYLYRKPKGYTDEEAIEYYINDLKKVFEECSPASHIAAIIVEPVLGEGGFVPAPFSWVKAVRKICDDHGILLIADEVQCGFGRSGRLFVSDYWMEEGCAPDIITSAKSIAGGLPLSAVTAGAEIFDGIPGGILGGTYSGNAVACAAALKVLEVIRNDHLLERARLISERCFARFGSWKEKYEVVGDVRGIGVMMGIEFVKNKETKEPDSELVSRLVRECAAKGLIIESAGTYHNVIRFLCPIVVTDEQLEAGFEILEQAIEACM
jgi:4-aminobutyrate aminotransferase/(S)-3-amino-2-methylpropionate transaminase